MSGSKYDYPDPGTAHAYCDGLSAHEEDPCLWCGGECDAGSPYLPYCGPDCAWAAERESTEDMYYQAY